MSRKKSMGLWAAISIGVGGMIGAGIFSILGIACQIIYGLIRSLKCFAFREQAKHF